MNTFHKINHVQEHKLLLAYIVMMLPLVKNVHKVNTILIILVWIALLIIIWIGTIIYVLNAIILAKIAQM